MPKASFITKAEMTKLLRNGANPDQDHAPVVKLFYPAGAATWLISEVDPKNPDQAFGLCDLGQGTPELGYVSLSELQGIRGRFGLGIERDRWFRPAGPMSKYVAAADAAGRIVENI